jgi:hypothetical protein
MESASEVLSRRGFAYRVLGMAAGSPCEGLGLVPWFDFITRAGGLDLVGSADSWNEDLLGRAVAQADGGSIALQVLSIKNRTLRTVVLKPRRWLGAGEGGPAAAGPAGKTGLAGLVVSYSTYAGAADNVVKVLGVSTNSPAHAAGLQPLTDYLLGTSAGALFRSQAGLVACVRAHAGRVMPTLVYSSAADTVRVANIIPSTDWPGEGLLGCDVGFGQAHALPPDSRETIGAFRHLGAPAEAKPETGRRNSATDAGGGAGAGTGSSGSSNNANNNAAATASAPNGKPPPGEGAQPPRAPPQAWAAQGWASDDVELAATVEALGGAAARISPRPDSSRVVPHEVRTDQGYGKVHGERAGALVVELDWKLPNHCCVVYFCQPHSYEKLPQLDSDP